MAGHSEPFRLLSEKTFMEVADNAHGSLLEALRLAHEALESQISLKNSEQRLTNFLFRKIE
jgi:hypothetical protein